MYSACTMAGRNISVVIPSFNGEALLREHLPALQEELQAWPGSELVVADDASTDTSCEFLAGEHPGARVIASAERSGFAENCNRGVRAARHDLVLCLNTDVAITPGFLRPLVQAMDDPGVFAASPAILLSARAGTDDANESLHRSFVKGGLLHHLRLRGVPAEGPPVPISYACGAAVLLRRPVFLDLGGFDTMYAPFYWEDVDLSYRAWKRGWRIHYVPGSAVHHRHRATIGRFHGERDVEAIYARNQYLFAWKNFTDAALTLAHFVHLAGRLVASAVPGRHEALEAVRLAKPLFGEAWRKRARERRERVQSDRAVLRTFRQIGRPGSPPVRR